MESGKEDRIEKDRCTFENRNSRHFSWLVKSCIPNTCDPFSPSPTAAAKTSHRKTISSDRKITATVNSSSATTTIASLPDDILLEILSRLPSLGSLTTVCRHWSHLLDSPSFLTLRRQRSFLHPTLFALSSSTESGPVCSSLHLQSPFPSSPWEISSPILPPYVDNSTTLILHNVFSHGRPVSIRRKIYLLGREATAELDPWSSTVRLLPATLFPRKKFATAAINGKIYAAGGSARSSAVEEFDPATTSWRVVSHAPRKRYGCLGVGMDGIFYVIGGLKIGPSASVEFPRATVSSSAVGLEPLVYASSMDLYDVEGRNWMRSRGVPGGGCVVAACGAMGCVYLLTSHAVKLSFWRFSVSGKTATTTATIKASNMWSGVYGEVGGDSGGGCSIGSGSNGGSGGEWCRMKSPPLPTQMKVDGMVRFGCAAVEDKVVLVQVMSCGEDLMQRRSGRSIVRGGCKGGIVLVFDCVVEEWSRGPDLPEGMPRATCACVEC